MDDVGPHQPGTAIVKTEIADDVKEYAQNAMNELLGLYGYDKEDDATSKVSDEKSCDSTSSSSDSTRKAFINGCNWCGKNVTKNSTLRSSAAAYCSESCFSQSRRATYKQAKTCDWCRHVRPSLNYIETQDGGPTVLYFCSEKCLNQYKMHIFWRETRAHLALHPDIAAATASHDSHDDILITPDLWLGSSDSDQNDVRCQSSDTLSPPPPPPPALPPPKSTPDAALMVPAPTPCKKFRASKIPSTKVRGRPSISVVPSSKLLTPLPSECAPTEVLSCVGSSPDRTSNSSCASSYITRKNRRKRQPVAQVLPSVPFVESVATPVVSDVPQDLRTRIASSPPLISIKKEVDPLELSSRATGSSTESSTLLPPATLLVPYPVMIPVPIPIPIPLVVPRHRTEEISTQTEAMADVDVAVVNLPCPMTRRVLKKRGRQPANNNKIVNGFMKNCNQK